MKNLKMLKGAKLIQKTSQKSINGGIDDKLTCSKLNPTCPPGYGCAWSIGRCVYGA